jgi:carbonic anhydrase
MTEVILKELAKKNKLCASKSNFKSPLKLSRDSSTPVFDRNSLELNLNTDMTSLIYNKKKGATLPTGKLDSTKHILYFNVADSSSVVSFNNREYSLKKMIIFSNSIHVLSKNIGAKDGKKPANAPLELVLQFESSDKSPDYLNMCIFITPGSKFDNSSTFFNQLLFKVNSSTKDNTQINSNKLNVYNVLPKNRSYFSYTGPWIEKPKIAANCFSKNDHQWIIYENSINIDTAEYDKLKNNLKIGKLGLDADESNKGSSQYVYYKSDKDATLAGMESGDVKYVKCSRKLMNEDPDSYRKYLYRRKSKNRRCDNILNMNKKLEKKFDEELNKEVDEDTLLGQINNIFSNKEDIVLNILTSTLMLIVLFIVAYISIFGIIYIVKYIKDQKLSTSTSTPASAPAPAAPAAPAI